MNNEQVVCSDCLEHMRTMPENSVDSIITDPPYGLAFMGVAWDTFGDGRKGGGRTNATFDQVGGNHHPTCSADQARTRKSENAKFQAAMTPIFEEALRVAKPGAHLLCFGGTRTFHRMACAIEDAGWEIRDCIMWVTGQGFPKSMDVSKAIEKKHGADAAAQWDGWGTCLKPAWEPIIVARKPLDGTVAHNVLTWGVGALNIDACRVATNDELSTHGDSQSLQMRNNKVYGTYGSVGHAQTEGQKLGRFPANLVHDGSQMVLDLFPQSKGQQGDVVGSEPSRPTDGVCYGEYNERQAFARRGDSGSAARFFYCAKASKKDRNYGCERLLTWAERDQELTQLLEQASSLLARDISESMMLNLVEQGCSTLLFGNESTVLSQEECRFITSTVIPLITASKTCSSSPRSNTSESILDAIRTSEESGISLARLADKSSQSRQDSTSGGTDTATSAVSALFGVLSEIRGRARVGNFHCTVKPTELMKWLVQLVTPEGGVVLDPFAGSGTTLVACKMLGRDCIGIEREPEYAEIIKRRLETA